MISCDYPAVVCYTVPVIAVTFVALSKAGFGGAAGLLTTPLLSLIFPAKFAVGFILPLLIVADWFTVYHYRFEWNRSILKTLIPGAILGIVLGTVLIDSISDDQLKKVIGAVVLIIAIYYLFFIQFRGRAGFRYPWWVGCLVGVVDGFLSAVAHSAGVVIALFLLSQNLPKRIFVATTALFFAAVNLLKLFPYVTIGLINPATLKMSVLYVVFIPIGVRFGIWLNRKMSQKLFLRIINIFVLIMAIQLLMGKNIFLILLGRR